MQSSVPESLRGLTVADVMLATPKTLAPDATVAEAREALADEHVQLLLFADGRSFRGAVTAIPDDADPGALALVYAFDDPPTIAPAESAAVAYVRALEIPYRRMIVLGPGDELLGLLCLKRSLTGFCDGARRPQ